MPEYTSEEMAELKAGIESIGSLAAERFEKLEKKLKEERLEREELELRIQRQGVGTGTGGGTKSTFRAEAEHKALASFVRKGEDAELKTMSVGSDPDGGYMVLPVTAESMVKKIFDQSAIARLARREVITAGDAWEEVVDFDEADATWVGENSARSATDTPQIGKIRIPVHEIYALQKVTQRLLDDTAFNVGGWINEKIADKFGRSEGAAYVSGDGVLKPQGILTYDTATTSDATRAFGTVQYVKTGSASSFGSTVATQADKLVEMIYALRAPYKAGDKVGWLMNSTTAGVVRKFKIGATTDAYAWSQGLMAGEPATLLGYPVWIDENMPDLGANTFPIAFGNWDLAYKIVEKAGIRMLRDPYTDKPNVLFYAYRRVGGGLTNSEALKLLKCEA